MQINCRGVLQRLVLLRRSRDDMRMAMAHADRHDAAKPVKITLALIVPDVLHLALDEHDRLFVVEEDARVHELLALREHFGGGRAGVGFRLKIKRWQCGCLHLENADRSAVFLVRADGGCFTGNVQRRICVA